MSFREQRAARPGRAGKLDGPVTPGRVAARPGSASVPILVYHVINTQPAGSSANPALCVPLDEFSSQMNALKADGWHRVTLNQFTRSASRRIASWTSLIGPRDSPTSS